MGKARTAGKRARYWRNIILFASLGVAVTLPIIVLRVAYVGANHYVRPVRLSRLKADHAAWPDVAYEDVSLYSADGVRLAAWYTPSQNQAMILVAHGFEGYRRADMHGLFARHGYGVISWDFRAHGESAGELCTLGYDEALDAEAALDFALQQPGIHHIGAWGGSMGGAALIFVAARRSEIEAIVTDSAYAAIEDELAMAVPFAPLRPFVRFFAEQQTGVHMAQLRPVDVIGGLRPRPVLIIHGEADRVAPVDAALRLYQAAGAPRALWTAPDVGHLNMLAAHPTEYEQRVIAFFDEALLQN